LAVKSAMLDPFFIWDLEDDPDGNVQHVAEHGLTIDEVESAFHSPDSWTDESRSSGRSITLGTTHTGRTIAVVWEEVDENPLTVVVVTAYEVGE
jgi:uncharacterized DUF497 family protein